MNLAKRARKQATFYRKAAAQLHKQNAPWQAMQLEQAAQCCDVRAEFYEGESDD